MGQPGPLMQAVVAQHGHSVTTGWGFLCQQGFVTENRCAERPLRGKSRKAEDGVASRLFSTLESLTPRSNSSPCKARTALNPQVLHKPFTQVKITQVGASRGESGHKEGSCHLGKRDTGSGSVWGLSPGTSRGGRAPALAAVAGTGFPR